MFLESREKILARIGEIISAAEDRSDILSAAVAFWGSGSQLLIKDRASYKLVCNLEHPGTNPFVVEQIMAKPNVTFLQHNDLHAKVVIGSAGTVVGSANFSERALGIQTADEGGWIEAAVFLHPGDGSPAEAGGWFEKLWQAARPISSVDVDLAKANWLARGGQPLEPQSQRVHGDESVVETSHELYDEDVFELQPLTKKSRNKTRMASDELVRLYYQTFEDEIQNNTTIKVPAHAANLIWVLSGREMSTNIEGIPTFKSPAIVIERAKALGTYDKVHAFVVSLAINHRVKPAIRFLAQRYTTWIRG